MRPVLRTLPAGRRLLTAAAGSGLAGLRELGALLTDALGGALVPAALFVAAGLLVGFAKTAIGGLASIAIAIFATLMPARESTAVVLLLLLVGDLVAVWHYRADADWSLLRRLLPAVLPGLLVGAVFLAVADDTLLRRSIGALLLVMALLQLGLRRDRGGAVSGASAASAASEVPAASRLAALGAGLGSGFATMTANAAGAVMTLYLVAQGVEKRRFLGTGALFFFGVNLAKLPISAGLGLLTSQTLLRAAVLAPAVLLGAWAGLHAASRLSQRHFDRAVLAATIVSALALVAR